jgi:hypothetical protein
MLDELLHRYGEDAIVTARPHMLDSGESYRWELQIDGMDVPGAYAHVRRDLERQDVMVMVLVYGDEEVELGRWSTKQRPHAPYGPAAVIRRLGDLQKGSAAS